MRDARPRGLSPDRRAIARFLALLGALSLLATAFIALARTYWFFELFSHFRVQLIATQVVLLIAFAILRHPRRALTLALACVINAAPIREYLLPVGEPAAPLHTGTQSRSEAAMSSSADGDGARQAIRVISVNVLATNPNAAALIRVLRSAQPDIFAIVELTEPFMDALAEFAAAWPHQMLLPEPGTFGIGVYSRWPLDAVDVIELEGVPAIDARIGGNEGGWHFVAAHLMPPMSSTMAELRNAQLRALAEHVRTIDAAHVVVGDFNLSPYSPLFEDFLRLTRLHSTLRGLGPTYTWPSFFPLLGIAIDHVLVSDAFTVTAYSRADGIGSDHYPVVVDMIPRRLRLD